MQRMCFKFIGLVLVGIVPFMVSCGPSKEEIEAKRPICLHAELTTGQVPHRLYSPDDKDIPKPLYKVECPTPEHFLGYQNTIGSATVYFDPATNRLQYAIAYTALSGAPIMIQLHCAVTGKSGPVLATLCSSLMEEDKDHAEAAANESNDHVSTRYCSTAEHGFLVGNYDLNDATHLSMTEEQLKQSLVEGKCYINVITCLNQKGEIRGAIKKISPKAQAVPGANGPKRHKNN